MSQYLSDPEYLFTLLVTLVKKNNGLLRISEEDLKNVTKGDLIGMYYEPKTGDVVLKEVDPEDSLQAADLVKQKQEDIIYEN
jgi:hypothetical protein